MLSRTSGTFCLVLLTISAATVTANVDVERIDHLIQLFRNATGIPGMAAAIFANGEPIFVRPYGQRAYADGKSDVTADTLFEIGSCSKAFTAYVAASLVREGVLAYTDPVIKHIPEFRLADASVTKDVLFKDLLDHASGLPSHDSVWYHANMSRNEWIQRLPHLPLSYGLREKFQYNNIMYGLAGIAMERASKRSWETEVRERIFAPLNMTRSLTSFAEAQRQPPNAADMAAPHTTVRDGTGVVGLPPLDITMIGPAGSLHSSINDMVKWVQLQMSDAVPKEMHLLHTPYRPVVPDKTIEEGGEVDLGYGYGWLIHLYRGQYVIRHSGQTDGFCAAVSLFPEEKYGVVLLSNLDTVGSTLRDLVLRISDIKSNRSMALSDEEWVRKIATRSSGSSSAEVGSEKPVDHPEQYAGGYWNAGYGSIEVSVVASASNLSALFNNIRYTLRPKAGADFFTLLPQTNARTDGGHKRDGSFSRDSSGEVVAFHVGFEPDVADIRFEKQLPQAQDLRYLGSFVGTFSSASASVKIILNEEKRLLVLDGAPQREPEALKVLKRNWFCMDRCTLRFEFVFADGKVSKLLVHESGEIADTLTSERSNRITS